VVTYSQQYCTKCQQDFNADLSDLAPPGSQYTHRVINLAVRLVVEDGLPYRPASCQFLAQNTHPHTPAKERRKALLERRYAWVKGAEAATDPPPPPPPAAPRYRPDVPQ
jgi:hypothetical protein